MEKERLREMNIKRSDGNHLVLVVALEGLVDVALASEVSALVAVTSLPNSSLGR